MTKNKVYAFRKLGKYPNGYVRLDDAIKNKPILITYLESSHQAINLYMSKQDARLLANRIYQLFEATYEKETNHD